MPPTRWGRRSWCLSGLTFCSSLTAPKVARETGKATNTALDAALRAADQFVKTERTPAVELLKRKQPAFCAALREAMRVDDSPVPVAPTTPSPPAPPPSRVGSGKKKPQLRERPGLLCYCCLFLLPVLEFIAVLKIVIPANCVSQVIAILTMKLDVSVLEVEGVKLSGHCTIHIFLLKWVSDRDY